jgi:hypothetical protein
MHFWFFICILATIAVVPAHFLSVEHIKLQDRYGEKKGKKIGGSWSNLRVGFLSFLDMNLDFASTNIYCSVSSESNSFDSIC